MQIADAQLSFGLVELGIGFLRSISAKNHACSWEEAMQLNEPGHPAEFLTALLRASVLLEVICV